MMMRFSFASYARTDSSDLTAETTKPVWSSANGLSGAHDTLSAIADLETRYEIERERIEQSSGSDESKQRDMADLEDRYHADRKVYEQRWRKLYG